MYSDCGYEVRIPVVEFSPEEIKIKVSANRLSVAAKYEAKPDTNGVIYHEFNRQFEIPKVHTKYNLYCKAC